MSIFAFVLMPFSSEFTDIYESGIKTTATEYNVVAQRLDEQIYDSDMLDQIYQQIERSDFIIADMSGRNANVFYEVGYADAKKKLIILLTQKPEDIPFDLKHRPHVVYEGSIKKLKEELGSRIAWAVKEIETRNKNPISAALRVRYTVFEREDHTDQLTVHFSLELTNLTETKIRGVELVYIYTGRDWSFFKDSKEIKSQKSDIQPYPLRHLITPEYSIIPQYDSVTIEFEGKKLVWKSWDNDSAERQDQYEIRGRVFIVVHTENLSHKVETVLEATAIYTDPDEIPF